MCMLYGYHGNTRSESESLSSKPPCAELSLLLPNGIVVAAVERVLFILSSGVDVLKRLGGRGGLVFPLLLVLIGHLSPASTQQFAQLPERGLRVGGLHLVAVRLREQQVGGRGPLGAGLVCLARLLGQLALLQQNRTHRGAGHSVINDGNNMCTLGLTLLPFLAGVARPSLFALEGLCKYSTRR
jgi:hypothetical protein